MQIHLSTYESEILDSILKLKFYFYFILVWTRRLDLLSLIIVTGVEWNCKGQQGKLECTYDARFLFSLCVW